MAAGINDSFTKVAAGVATTLDSPGYTMGATTITLISTTNWPTDTAVFFTIYTTELNADNEEVEVAGTRTIWKGIVNALTVEQLDLISGNDQNYAAGTNTKVDIVITAEQHNAEVDALLEEHNQDGTHGDVTADTLTVGGTSSTQFPSQFADFFDDGVVWATSGTLTTSMTSGYVWYNGERKTVPAIASKTFTASKDTYVDIDPGTGTPTYIEAANGGAAPALTAGNVRAGYVVTSAGAVTGFTAMSRKPVSADNVDFPYATTEHLTGRTWIDGKPIYEKTINFGSLTNNTSKSVAHGISTMAYLISFDGIATNGILYFPLPMVSSSAVSSGIQVTIDATNVTINPGSDRTLFSAYVTLWYTKA